MVNSEQVHSTHGMVEKNSSLFKYFQNKATKSYENSISSANSSAMNL